MKGEDYECRRDALAGHVKAKHIAEIKRVLLEEYKSYAGKSDNFSTLRRMMDGKCPPIYSELYENAEYWFGVKPNIFMDEESKSQMSYKASQMNMDAHQAFLNEIMDAISLTEMLTVTHDMTMKSPEVTALKKRVRELENMMAELGQDLQQKEAYIESLKQDVQDFKDLGDVQSSVADLKRSLNSAMSTGAYYRREAEKIKSEYAQYREETEKAYHEELESRGVARLSLESQNMEISSKLHEMEMTVKRKIADGVAKEMEKIRRDKEKEKEKAKKDKKRAKEKLREAEMMAKLKAKMQKKASKAAADSDSDSSDASDSSDSDDE